MNDELSRSDAGPWHTVAETQRSASSTQMEQAQTADEQSEEKEERYEGAEEEEDEGKTDEGNNELAQSLVGLFSLFLIMSPLLFLLYAFFVPAWLVYPKPKIEIGGMCADWVKFSDWEMQDGARSIDAIITFTPPSKPTPWSKCTIKYECFDKKNVKLSDHELRVPKIKKGEKARVSFDMRNEARTKRLVIWISPDV